MFVVGRLAMQWFRRVAVLLDEFKFVFLLIFVTSLLSLMFIVAPAAHIHAYPNYIVMLLSTWLMSWALLLKPMPSRAVLVTNRLQWIAWKWFLFWQKCKAVIFCLMTLCVVVIVAYWLVLWLG